MNREIEFRAWDKYLKKMITPFAGFHYFKESDKCNEMNVLFQNWDEEIPEEFTPSNIMEFTGLKDKKGNKVFEGDVVSWHDFYEGDYKEYAGVGWIEWDEEHHYVAKELSDGTIGYVCSTWDLVHNYGGEVIGNKYQNPELL